MSGGAWAQTAEKQAAEAQELLALIGAGAAAAAVVALTVLGLVVTRLWAEARDRRNLSDDVRRLLEVLSTAPDGHILWAHEADSRDSKRRPARPALCSRRLAILLDLFKGVGAGYDDVLAAFAPEPAQRLDEAVKLLRQRGEGFDIELETKDGGQRIRAMGIRATNARERPLADVVWMRDVTHESRSRGLVDGEEEELRAEADLLREVLDTLPMPVWVRDESLAIAYCNQAYADAVEMPSPEAALAEGWELAPGETAMEARAVAARARAAGEPRSATLHLVIGGERRLIQLTETPIGDPHLTEDGERQHKLTAGLASDVTAVEEAETALDHHIAAHATVLESLPVAVAIFGPDTRLQFSNRSFADLWGLPEDWLAEEPSYATLMDTLRSRRMLPEEADFRAYRENELRRFNALIEPTEDLMHLPNGITLLRSISPHPLGGLLFVYEDVTDLLGLESSYNALIAVQKETLDHLTEAVAVFDREGRLRLSNPAFARLWELASDDLGEGILLSELIEKQHPFFARVPDWAAFKAQLIGLVTDRQPHEGRLGRSDGVTLTFHSYPLQDGGVMLTYGDVTHVATVQQALLDSNATLRDSSRLHATLVSDISKELAAPLATLTGYADVLAQGQHGELSDRQLQYVGGIKETARTLSELTRDILDLAAIEAGEETLSLDTVEVAILTSGLMALVRERARRKDIRLHYDCPEDIGWLVADEKRLRQVLYTLLSNAVEAVPEKGVVALTVAQKGGEMVFSVADNGEGLEDGMWAPPRDGFLSPPPPESAPAASRRLGLALVRSFVALHGGTVELKAEDGGTVVLCRLPTGAAHDSRQLALPEAPPQLPARVKSEGKAMARAVVEDGEGEDE